jgi:hypothetical protein
MAAAVVAGSAVDICFEFEVGEMALDKGGGAAGGLALAF